MNNKSEYWTSIIKRVFNILIYIIGIYLSFKLAIFYMPFLVAFIIAQLMEPVIKFLMKKLKISRKLSSIIIFIITFGILIGMLAWGIVTLISESTNLLSGLNDHINKGYNYIQELIKSFDLTKINISTEILNVIQNSSYNLLNKIELSAQSFLTKLLSIVTSIPNIAIYLGITVVSLYFICTDKIYMLDELEHHLPKKWVAKIGTNIRGITKTLGAYIKSQAILVFICFIISLIGLYIFKFFGMNVVYPLSIALSIAFVDALPILGSGTIMVPWAVFSALDGDLTLGISIVVLWIIMCIVRQLLEPKIVSGNIGIHPIFTLISMYTGFKLIGVVGMFVGPIVLIILKNVFATVIDEGVVKTLLDME